MNLECKVFNALYIDNRDGGILWIELIIKLL